MLLYGLLHLTGYDLPLSELERFRQLHSRTPGHPERGHTPGVEITTGPLGQGFANAVGFALAERMLAARYNRPGHEVIDHRTWFICSDGDLMEGISHEAASFAGHLGLERLVGIYDDNKISLDGPTSLSYDENVPMRFEAYGWRVLHVDDGNDLDALGRAYAQAQVADGRPTLIDCRTHIGYGSPHKQDTAAAHGSALGEDEVRATKRVYGWPEDAHFLVPPEVARLGGRRCARGARPWSPSGTSAMEAYAGGVSGRGRASCAGCCPASCRRAGGTPSRASRPTTARSPPGRPAAGSSTPWPRRCPSWSRARRTSPAPPTRRSRARATSSAGTTASATSATACASTPWAPSPTAWTRTAACARPAPPSSSSTTT